VAAAACMAAAPSFAAWHKASSKHFIIYSDDRPERLRAYAERLEKFDQAVRRTSRMEDFAVGDGNRLTIFVTRSVTAVQKLAGDRSGTIAGWYMGHASGPVAFVPRATDMGELTSDIVFFHEYAHHLMFQDVNRPYPQWFVEGFAEFMSTVTFEKDGRIVLGRAAQHRATGLFYLDDLPLERMLSGNYQKLNATQTESLYGRGWLLTHYLAFDETRKGQLETYLGAMADGVPPLDAARKAFGDLKVLDRNLNRYLNQSRILARFMAAGLFTQPVIDVQPLSAGAAEVLPLRMESKRGVDGKTAEPLAAKVRKVQASHKGDYLVEITLAEAEIDAGHPEASEAAADRALAANPKSTEAMIYKGRSIVARAEKARSSDPKLFDTARSWFMRANKLDTEDPEPLMEFYKSYIAQGVQPTKNAVEALHYASNLAPQDLGLRINSAMQYVRDRDLPNARRTLVPIAYNPHGDEMANVAKAVIARIDAGDAAGAEKVAEAGPNEQPARESSK
jgi:hypothetical protein